MVLGFYGDSDTLVWATGTLVDTSISCHTWWSLVWSRSGCNSVKNTIVGMCNSVSVVKLIVDI